MSQYKTCDVIDFSSRVKSKREVIKKSKNEDLLELLRNAYDFQQNIPLLRNCVTPAIQEEVETLIRVSLIIKLRKDGKLNLSSLICATYAANLLMKLFCKTIVYWSAFDFLNRDQEEIECITDPIVIQHAADACFIISSYFTEEDEGWGAVKLRYYENIGIDLYTNFYSQTKVDTGLYMSENFLLISEIVSKYLKTLKYSA